MFGFIPVHQTRKPLLPHGLPVINCCREGLAPVFSEKVIWIFWDQCWQLLRLSAFILFLHFMWSLVLSKASQCFIIKWGSLTQKESLKGFFFFSTNSKGTDVKVAIISSCRQDGELPVNIHFSLSLQKEGTIRNCALALKTPVWIWSQQLCSHFIDQSDLVDRSSPQKGVLPVTQRRSGTSMNIFLCVDITIKKWGQIPLVLFSQSCLTLWPHGLQHARLPCPSLSSRVYSNSSPLS